MHHTPPRQQMCIGCCGVLTRWRYIHSTAEYIHTLNNGVVSNRWHKACVQGYVAGFAYEEIACLYPTYGKTVLPWEWKYNLVPLRDSMVNNPMGNDSCVCPLWNIHCRRKSVFLQTRSVELEKMSGPLEPISVSLFGHWLFQSNRTTHSQPIPLFHARYFLQWSRECLWKWCYRHLDSVLLSL